ncbi:MAG: hypothetical protein FVQ81_13115 [Candidatus Glassbacteria bacterium]|nr:hypothetical protein [Candidatus Glassbacteria bacterium]
MPDLVVTVPKRLWRMWIDEGDCPGDPPTGDESSFYVGHRRRPNIAPGERLYIVCWGRLRGYAPVTRVVQKRQGWAICREGGAVAVTIRPFHWLARIKGFRGWRYRWWDICIEVPFPGWKTDEVGR